VRAVGASVFRQLFAQLSSEVAHFTHPYYFEATSCSTFYPSCTLRAFLGLKRALLSQQRQRGGWFSTQLGINEITGLGLPYRRGNPARLNDLTIHSKNKNNNTRKGWGRSKGPQPNR
jgi:hypothetical protein